MLGTVSLGLGILGIFLPLLPTTPFLLLTASLYVKASPKAYQWLIDQPHLGKYIRNYREHKIIPLRAKVASLGLMWGSMLCCILFWVPYGWLKAVLGLVAVLITWHILSFKSR